MKSHQLASNVHPQCFVCSAANDFGLALQFLATGDGGVSATFLGSQKHEGYPGLLHGGIIAALLDGAMTNCLFANDIEALTAELNIRYFKSVTTHHECTVSANIENSRHGLSNLSAKIIQGGEIKASAAGKFMPRKNHSK